MFEHTDVLEETTYKSGEYIVMKEKIDNIHVRCVKSAEKDPVDDYVDVKFELGTDEDVALLRLRKRKSICVMGGRSQVSSTKWEIKTFPELRREKIQGDAKPGDDAKQAGAEAASSSGSKASIS